MEFLAPGGKQINCCAFSVQPEHLSSQQKDPETAGGSFYVAYRDGGLSRFTIPSSAEDASQGEEGGGTRTKKLNVAETTSTRSLVPAPTQMSIQTPVFAAPATDSAPSVTMDPLLLCSVPNVGFSFLRLETLETVASFSLENVTSGTAASRTNGNDGGEMASQQQQGNLIADTCWLNPTTAVVAEASGTVHIIKDLLVLPSASTEVATTTAEEEQEEGEGDTPTKKQKKPPPQAEMKISSSNVHFGPLVRLVPQSASEIWVVGPRQMVLLNTETEEVSKLQTMDLPEPIAAVATLPTDAANSSTSFWCASENFISLVAPNNTAAAGDQQLIEAKIMGCLGSDQPLSAAFATKGGHTYVVTNGGDIVEVLQTTQKKEDPPTTTKKENEEAEQQPTEAPPRLVPQEGTLSILRAMGLLQRDGAFTGKSDPFVKVFQQGEQIHRTKTVDDKLNPVWAEGTETVKTKPDASIRLEVWEDDNVSGNDFMGCVTITQDQLQEYSMRPQGAAETLELKLERRENEESEVVLQADDLGVLVVGINFPEPQSAAVVEKQQEQPTPTEEGHAVREESAADEGSSQQLVLRFGDDFGIEALDQEDSNLQPFRVDLLSDCGINGNPEALYFMLTAPSAITIAANREGQEAGGGGGGASGEEDEEKDPLDQPEFQAFDHDGVRLVITGELWAQVQSSCQSSKDAKPLADRVVSPVARTATTVGLDTSDLQSLRHMMDDVIMVRLIGEGSSGPGGGITTPGMGPESDDEHAAPGGSTSAGAAIRYVAVPHGCTLSLIRDKLESLYDRRLVISFPSMTSVTSSGQRKLIELRPTSLKIFHAISSQDEKSLVCRPLYPQVSRARSTTPGVGSGSVSRTRRLSATRGEGDAGDTHNTSLPLTLTGSPSMLESSHNRRSKTVLSHTEHQAMVGRLYTETQRAKAIQQLQLEEKFLPRLPPSKLEAKTEKDMVRRLTEGSEKKKQQHRDKILKQFEKEGHIRQKDTRPNADEEEAIIQKYYYEGMNKEKAREKRLDKKLFKKGEGSEQKQAPKLNAAQWAEWQEKMARKTRKNRLKDQYYVEQD